MSEKILKILFVLIALIMICTNVYATPGEWFPQESHGSNTQTLKKVTGNASDSISILTTIVINVIMIVLTIKQLYKDAETNSECKNITKKYLIAIILFFILSIVSITNILLRVIEFVLFIFCVIVISSELSHKECDKLEDYKEFFWTQNYLIVCDFFQCFWLKYVVLGKMYWDNTIPKIQILLVLLLIIVYITINNISKKEENKDLKKYKSYIRIMTYCSMFSLVSGTSLILCVFYILYPLIIIIKEYIFEAKDGVLEKVLIHSIINFIFILFLGCFYLELFL